jgi:hypothetical protein
MCYAIPFFGYGMGVGDLSGKNTDLWAAGLVSIMVNILVHHVQIFLLIRNYTVWILVGSIFSLSMIPFTWVIIDFVAGVPLWRRHFYDIYGN